MTHHSPEQLSIALGCVIHDALILAIAISMRRNRRSRPKIEGLDWGEAQIAIDVSKSMEKSPSGFVVGLRAQSAPPTIITTTAMEVIR